MTSLSWSSRLACAAVAIVGTAAFVLSFAGYALAFDHAEATSALQQVGLKIGVASGASWLIFGALILAQTGGVKNALYWGDICLKTMAWGIGILSISTALNLMHIPVPEWLHGVVILASNLFMMCFFVMRGEKLQPETAIGLWLFALDLPFILIVWLWP